MVCGVADHIRDAVRGRIIEHVVEEFVGVEQEYRCVFVAGAELLGECCEGGVELGEVCLFLGAGGGVAGVCAGGAVDGGDVEEDEVAGAGVVELGEGDREMLQHRQPFWGGEGRVKVEFEGEGEGWAHYLLRELAVRFDQRGCVIGSIGPAVHEDHVVDPEEDGEQAV